MKPKSLKSLGKKLVYPALIFSLAASPFNSNSQNAGLFNSKEEASPLEINVSEFQNYHPKPEKGDFLGIEYNEEVEPKDGFVEQNMKYGLPSNCFHGLVYGNSGVDGNCKERKSQTNVEIKNPDKFKSKVVETAKKLANNDKEVSKMLPKGVESIDDLSIHESIYLSGKITAERLNYDNKMTEYSDSVDIDTTSKKNEYFSIIAEGLKGKDSRNEEAKKADRMTEDELFYREEAICRHYAPVNQAVFNVLKDMNNDLNNTYMLTYSPKNLGHKISLPHAWNKVNTFNRSDDTLKVHSAYVDPTWLDTRTQTADNSGESSNITDKEAYDAVDTLHFGENKFFIDKYLGDFFNELSQDRNNQFNENWNISKEAVENYKENSLESKISSLNRLIDARKSGSGENHSYIKNEFLSLMKIASQSSISSYHTLNGNFREVSENKYEDIRSVYNSIKNNFPELYKEEISVMPGSHPEDKSHTSIKELYNKFDKSQTD